MKICVKNADFGYRDEKVIKDATFTINKGEFCAIVGTSGSGKSTLLNLLGGMDKATSGSIMIGEDDIAKFNDSELTRYRAHDVGFIFQFYNIMPTLTVEEIANLCGYNNTVHFHRQFKQITGMTPGKCRD